MRLSPDVRPVNCGCAHGASSRCAGYWPTGGQLIYAAIPRGMSAPVCGSATVSSLALSPSGPAMT
jgi:hypothetical protein